MGGALGLEAESLEGLGSAVVLQDAHLVALLAAATAFAFSFFNLVAHLLEQVGVLVGAEDGGLAEGDVHVALAGGGFHLVLHQSSAEGLAHAACLFHFEEVLPGALGYLVGEVLDIVASGGGVDNLVEVALFLEQQLLVAGDAVAEVVGLLVGVVEGEHRDGVGTGHGRRHGFGGGAQHVDIGVVDRLVPSAGGGVDEKFVGAVALGLVLLDYLAPEEAGGADLGNLHEVGAAHAHVELDTAGHAVGLASGIGQTGHQLICGGQ